jgi:hypothetical protein
MNTLILLFAVPAGLVFWGMIIVRWQRGLWWLLFYVPYGGIISLTMQPSSIPLLLKDFLFVIPLYIAFFLFNTREVRNAPVPQIVLLSMGFLAVLVLLQSMNAGILHWMVAAIGVKVWLFYMPLIFVTGALLATREDLIKLLRVMVGIGIVPCLVGLLQWFGSATIGYEATISAFYGEAAASNATQGFASFDYGGTYYRILSTFTFTSQYFGYTMGMVVMAYALLRIDPSPKWQRFALIMIGVFVVASILSGARGALVFIPMLLVFTVFLDRRLKGIFAGVVIMPIVVVTALYLGGINPLEMFFATQRLVGLYSESMIYRNIVDAIWNHPLGIGTGMNTGPARHAFAEKHVLVYLETYYAKAIVELGLLGGVAIVAVFTSIVVTGYGQLRSLRDPALKGVAAALVAFFVTIAIHSGKGWQVDYDPINIYFWLFAGILYKLRAFETARVQQRVRAPQGMRAQLMHLHRSGRVAAAGQRRSGNRGWRAISIRKWCFSGATTRISPRITSATMWASPTSTRSRSTTPPSSSTGWVPNPCSTWAWARAAARATSRPRTRPCGSRASIRWRAWCESPAARAWRPKRRLSAPATTSPSPTIASTSSSNSAACTTFASPSASCAR